ncbi:MAG: HEAT repeat domain-containing protein [Acidobacteria bacterium]|nr:HEAT repeat domain-containing protein [Acidobacteriota bacterium]
MTNKRRSSLAFAKTVVLSWFVLIANTNSIFSQESAAVKQEQFAKLIASGNDEQRLEGLIELGNFLSISAHATPLTVALLNDLLRNDSSPLMRALSARAMEFSRDERFVSILLSSLKTERELAVRKAIIYAFSKYPSTEVVYVLLSLLKDKQQDIRAASVFSLAEIGDPVSTPALIELLKNRGSNEDAFARTQAVRALGKIGDRAAIDPLLHTLGHSKFPEVRREAVRSLGQIATSQDTKVIEALKLIELQSDPYLASIASSILEKLRP